ncbi:MAG: carboxypeptidase regulatory-like domain-containing protein [Bryobacteraceae bacterium]|nr:carboxypeptidase-like regulatory domain-containing protein [Bryobacterales bacterium]NUN02766.1 carboxypeptidase regulatory-like domain-containing protein [Bryobacteraceae bacterium]
MPQTDTSGSYMFPLVPPGSCPLIVEVAGFKWFTREFTLTVDQSARVDGKPEVSQVNETVTVSGQAILLRGDMSALGQVVSNKQVINLPLNGRHASALAALAPGTTPLSTFRVRVATQRAALIAPAPNNFQANGGLTGNNEMLLDGAPIVVRCQGQPATMPSVETVEEFKVQTNSSQVEFGYISSGILNFLSNGGTNAPHGSSFWQMRNEQLDANNFFSNRSDNPPLPARADLRLPLRYSQYGLPQRYTLSAVWEIPFGRGRRIGAAVNRWVQGVNGGWQVNGNLTLERGVPLVVRACSQSPYAGPRPSRMRGRQAGTPGNAHERLGSPSSTLGYINAATLRLSHPDEFGGVARPMSDPWVRLRHDNLPLFKTFAAFGVVRRQANTTRQVQPAARAVWYGRMPVKSCQIRCRVTLTKRGRPSNPRCCSVSRRDLWRTPHSGRRNPQPYGNPADREGITYCGSVRAVAPAGRREETRSVARHGAAAVPATLPYADR